ncbi:hypothetical protein [Azospira inquinata]|uniref:Uncharacterized protein n=1 Tax=Azospira inquinata TaxID=2785627 RepID=A0A975SQH3_9RHOO|nr:hypothetical protein [Azospira inquinata]QWT47321.1 hypothetical protein J8L76_06375 [Azospira inquinata]QWT50054.1 hypothetical protein Azoinq_05500 [Azospira inquinata]
MMHKLYIDAEFKIGNDAWCAAHPAGYEVDLSEPMMKAAIELTELPQHVSILVALQQTGLLDWALSTAYDALWEYLSRYFQAIPQGAEEATASLKIKDQEGKLRISMDGISPRTLNGAKIALKDKVTTDPAGVQSAEHTIEVVLAKHR